MATNNISAKPEPFGPFQHGGAWLLHGRFCSNDTASAATAASYRYESRVRELQQRFEIDTGVRDAYLKSRRLDLEEQ